jgi:hypothetical protein
MFSTKKQYRKELDAAKKDLGSYTTMHDGLCRIMTRLEKRLITIDKDRKSPFRKTMNFQIANGIEKAGVTKRGLADQIAYMEHIVKAIKQHGKAVIGHGKG